MNVGAHARSGVYLSRWIIPITTHSIQGFGVVVNVEQPNPSKGWGRASAVQTTIFTELFTTSPPSSKNHSVHLTSRPTQPSAAKGGEEATPGWYDNEEEMEATSTTRSHMYHAECTTPDVSSGRGKL